MNGGTTCPFERLQRAPRISTSSAVRSPEPWNQQTSKSPFGVSTTDDEWLCQDSSGKISSLENWGCADGTIARPAMVSRTARQWRMDGHYRGPAADSPGSKSEDSGLGVQGISGSESELDPQNALPSPKSRIPSPGTFDTAPARH